MVVAVTVLPLVVLVLRLGSVRMEVCITSTFLFLSFQVCFLTFHCVRQVAYEEFKAASEAELKPQRISEGSIGTFFWSA
jgi:hypothetical protein